MAKKEHRYLTEEDARKLSAGNKLWIGHDDFNRSSMFVEVVGPRDGRNGRFELTVKNVTPGEDVYEFNLYSSTLHRGYNEEAIMCLGSGCERVFYLN